MHYFSVLLAFSDFRNKKILFFKSIYLFIFREGNGWTERERNINVWLPLMCPLLGTWPATQACAPTGNGTSNPLVHRLALNPRSHTSQGIIIRKFFLKNWLLPWLLWLSGLSAGLQTRRSRVQFPVGAHAWVAGQVPSWGCGKGNQSVYLLHMDVSLLSFSLPSSL